MKRLELRDLVIAVDFEKGNISSLSIRGKERLASAVPLFALRLRDKAGVVTDLTAYDAETCTPTEDGAIYGFSAAALSVAVHLTDEGGEAAWRISATPQNEDFLVEWVEFPKINLPLLRDNAEGGGRILFPFNEGVLVSDIDRHERAWITRHDAEYPSRGNYSVFPNMICSQMLAYLWEDVGLYVGAHDGRRGVKEIDFLKEGEGVSLRFRLFCGVDFGEPFEPTYPIVFSVTGGNWESAAERYRAWFESALPKKARKISENPDLPAWYEDSPLVVTYPVRGVHDMDEMKPNKLYPYTAALPILDEVRAACDTRLLVLLMHWEGTAPWAPPYVWPPYGGTEKFDALRNALHGRGDLLGVYCSGFGYTLQSNLIETYNKQEEYEKKELWRGMCAGADGKVAISNICTDQRSGYDICPASEVGKALLREAYEPLLTSGIDYAQILDQNHGGGQYFCYSRKHGHAPVPGTWMTENMQDVLCEWNEMAKKTLLGCESAAAEPFIGNLLLSDNRFELNYFVGNPVPLYAYVYHQYLRNFMGNQVCCPFPVTEDTLRYRMAYSFSVGDCMTLVLTQDGDLAASWGQRDFTALPDKKKALRMVANLSRFYKEKAKPYLLGGRMTESPTVSCDTVTWPVGGKGYTVTLPTVLSSAWESENGRAVILVNPEDREQICEVDKNTITIPPLDAVLVMVEK